MKKRKVSVLFAIMLTCSQVMSIAVPAAAQEIILDESAFEPDESPAEGQEPDTESPETELTDSMIDVLSVEEVLAGEIPEEVRAHSETEKEENETEGSANVIISVSTGALINYIVIVLVTFIVMGLLAYVFVKKILIK